MKDFFGSYVRELGISFHSLAPILFLISQLSLIQTKHKTVLLIPVIQEHFPPNIRSKGQASELRCTSARIYLIIYLFYLFIYPFVCLLN